MSERKDQELTIITKARDLVDETMSRTKKFDKRLRFTLNLLCDYAVENGQIHDTIAECDLFDTRLMGCVTPHPSEVVRKF